MAESRARSLANLANQNALSVDSSSLDVGISSASPDSDLNVGASIKMDGPSGIITATSFSGDGSGLIGVASTDNIITGTAATFNNVVDVNGQLDVGSNIKIGNAGVITATSFSGDGANLTNVGVDTATVDTGSLKVSGISTLTGYVSMGSTVGAAGSIYFPDNKGINFGNNAEGDLQILHNGTDSIVQDVGTGKLVLKGNTAVEIRGTNNEDLGVFNQGGNVRLYHSGNERFQTNTDGFEVIHAGAASTTRINVGGSVGVGIGVTTTTGRAAAGAAGTVTGQIVFNETTGFAEVYNGNSWDTMSNKFSASGGTKVTPGDGNTYHVFTSPGSFIVEGAAGTIDLLVAGGGGGGGGGVDSTWYPGSGGGAGGVAYGVSKPIAAGSYTVTVGSGGGGGAGAPGGGPGTNGTAGGNSSFGDPGSGTLGQPDYVLGKGGGGGGWGAPPSQQATPVASITGGSGGGAPSHEGDGGEGTQPGTNPGFSDYGNDGGDNPSATGGSLGGGGAGSAGPDGSLPDANPSRPGGNGQPFPAFASPNVGPGVPSPLRPAFNTAVGPTGLYGGGGGGGQATPNNAGAGEGGPGGGADGGPGAGDAPSASNGISGTGGGAGGGGTQGGVRGWAGGTGGPGIVIVRYTT